MKVGMLIEHNSESNFRSGATLDLTFGDLFIGKKCILYYFSNFYLKRVTILMISYQIKVCELVKGSLKFAGTSSRLSGLSPEHFYPYLAYYFTTCPMLYAMINWTPLYLCLYLGT